MQCVIYTIAHWEQIILIKAPAQLTIAGEKWTLFSVSEDDHNVYVYGSVIFLSERFTSSKCFKT